MRRGDPPPTVVRQSKYAPRTLFSIFFKSNGPFFHSSFGTETNYGSRVRIHLLMNSYSKFLIFL
jgi:hypothetical protein